MSTAAAVAVPRMTLTRAIARSGALPAAVMLVAAVAPFEVPLPGSIAGFTLTTSEAAIVAALGVAGAGWLRDRSSFRWRSPIARPLAALAVCAFAAAAVAQEFRADALRVAARLAVAAVLALIVANLSRSNQRASRLIAVVLCSAAVVGVIGVLELTQLPSVMHALTVFRPGFHVVGGQLRATSTLTYPTTASMFLEIAFALGLALIGSGWNAFVLLTLVAAGVVATFTRAGLITMSASLLIYGGTLFLRRGWTSDHSRLAALAAGIVALVLMSRSPQMLVARLSAEGSQEWYGAAYVVPERIAVRAGSFSDIPVTLTNEGRLTWQSDAEPPFALSYHWLSSDTEEIVSFDGLRTPFEQPVEPGRAVTMRGRVHAPEYPGTYLLVWDVVQEDRTWLSLEGVYPGRSIVTVDGAAIGAAPPTHGRMPGSALRMPRAVLWRVALDIWREHPLLGIGPDNFRHVYGRYLGLASWDTRVHANNSYLEVLTGMGLAGATLLAWLIVAALRPLRTLMLRSDPARLPIAAAACAACVAIAAHALVDSFLTFTPTYVAFAIAAGLMFQAQDGVSCA